MISNIRSTLGGFVTRVLLKYLDKKFDSLNKRFDSANERFDYNGKAIVELQGRIDKLDDALAHTPRTLQQLQLRYEADIRQLRIDWRATMYTQQQALLGAARALTHHTATPVGVDSVLLHSALPNIAATHPIRVLMPQALDAQAKTGHASWLDLGCGAGHWMQELTTAGISPRGVDRRQSCAASQVGTAVVEVADELHTLQAQPAGMLAGVSAFDLLERINPQQVPQLIASAWMALAPGGVLMLSGANPENLAVATFGLWAKPERTRLWLAHVLADYAQTVGFCSPHILKWRMTEAGEPFIQQEQLAPAYLQHQPDVDAEQLMHQARNAPEHWALVLHKL